MSRNLILIPKDNTSPDWDTLPEEDGLYVFKIQVDPQKVEGLKRNNTVLQVQGNRHAFFVKKAERLPGPPSQEPLQPYKVWCELLT